jgi:hypothetical protein
MMSYNADLTFAKDMPKFDCSILSMTDFFNSVYFDFKFILLQAMVFIFKKY